MVAFSTLLQAVHVFVDDHGSPPVAFYHDRQQEFGRSMQEVVSRGWWKLVEAA
jgi:hypothetical protein